MSLTVLNKPAAWSDQAGESTAGEPVLTITVQITMVGDELPAAATRLLTDLEALVASQPMTVAEPSPSLRLVRPPRPRSMPPPPPPPPLATGSPEVASPSEPSAAELAQPAIRRIGRHGDDATPSLYLCTGSRLVLRDGAQVQLTRREYDLFQFFCEHPRRVFSRAQLLRHVWGYDMVGTERTVDVHVRRLRVKLGDCASVITTVRGVGYRLDDDAPVAIVVQPD